MEPRLPDIIAQTRTRNAAGAAGADATALSRKFIELHGGKIWVTSQLGTGSTFTFTFPLRR